MNDDEYLQGIIYDGSFVVVFSAFRAVGFDSCGRDAKYYAAAFVNRADWPNINFDELLKDSFFHRPSRQLPGEIIYQGGGSAQVSNSVLDRFRDGGPGPRAMDFSCLGNFLSQYYYMGMDWRFYRSNSILWHGPDIVFTKPILVGKVAMLSNKPKGENRIQQGRGRDFGGQSVSTRRVAEVSGGVLHSVGGDLGGGVNFSLCKKCEEIEALCIQLASRLQMATLIVGVLMLLNLIFIGATLFSPKLDCERVANEMVDHQEKSGLEALEEIVVSTNLGEVVNVQSNIMVMSTNKVVGKKISANSTTNLIEEGRRKENE